jgi:hypothetical protein
MHTFSWVFSLLICLHFQRLLWRAQAELALARRDPARALQLIDQVIASLTDGEQQDDGLAPHLRNLRAAMILALNRVAEAEAVLQARTTLEETASPDATPRRGYSPRLPRKSPSRGERVTPPR